MDVNIYIGSDNQTNTCDVAGIRTVMDRHCEGYTLVPGVLGVWQRVEERSAIVVVSGIAPDALDRLLSDLCESLGQFAVGYQEVAPIKFFEARESIDYASEVLKYADTRAAVEVETVRA